MHPVFDADALLLLALVRASKRRPASLDEIIIALAALRPELPGAAKLRDAFVRLSVHGLICQSDDAIALTGSAQTLLASQPLGKELLLQIRTVKDALAPLEALPEAMPIEFTAARIAEALKAWQASLPPPTKSERFAKRTGQRVSRGRIAPRGRRE